MTIWCNNSSTMFTMRSSQWRYCESSSIATVAGSQNKALSHRFIYGCYHPQQHHHKWLQVNLILCHINDVKYRFHVYRSEQQQYMYDQCTMPVIRSMAKYLLNCFFSTCYESHHIRCELIFSLSRTAVLAKHHRDQQQSILWSYTKLNTI